MINSFEIKQPFVVDVSSWEDKQDWSQITPRPFVAITRATFSNWLLDSSLAWNWAQFKDNGIPKTAYGFPQPMYGADDQAKFFCETMKAVGGWDEGDLPPVLDFETAGFTAHQIKVYLDRVEGEFGMKPIIYTRRDIWDTICTKKFGVFVSAPSWTSDYPCWVGWYPWADYIDSNSTVPKNRMPRGWSRWALWQYSEAGRLSFDKVNGYDFNVMSDWYKDEIENIPEPNPDPEPIPPVEPPVEEPRDVVSGKLLYGMNLRTSATTTAVNNIGYLFKHTEVEGKLVPEGANSWLEIDGGSLGKLYVAEYHNGKRYIDITDTTQTPEPTPYTDEIVIPEAEEGWGFYQLLHDNPPRQDNFTESKDRHLPMPETVKVMAKELWETVPQAWVDFQLDLVRLDSPGRTEEQHLATRHSMVEDNRAFTDLDNYIDDEHYNWKVSLSTGGNIVYGWRNGRNLHIKCLDMSKAPPKAEDVYNKPWLIWRATQIHPRVEYLFDGDVQVGERRNKLPDGTYRVTHFPQGKNCTTFPNMINGGEKVIPDWHIARKLEAGDVVKVVNLASDQT